MYLPLVLGHARRLLLCVSAVAVLTPASPTFAATGDEMIVTARKREESLQEVPLSITALSGEQLRERGIQDNYDLAYFTPNFNTIKQVGRRLDRPVIRGMAGPSTNGEPNASYFIDGVYISHRSSISTATLEVMERTEVIRGPQSSQFGRATFSGAINYVTRKTSDVFEAQLTTKAGENDNYKLGGWLSGPIFSDRLMYLVSANWEKYGGQWHNSLAPDSAYPTGNFIDPPQQGDTSRLGNEETQDLLAKLTWLPFDGSRINLKYSFADADDGHFPSLITRDLNCWLPPEDLSPVPQPGEPSWWRTTEGAFCGAFDPRNRENRLNLPDFRNGIQLPAPPGEELADFLAAPGKPGTRRETRRVLAEWEQDVRDWQVTVRGSYSEDEFEQGFDLDRQEVRAVFGLFNMFQQTKMRDWSGELRIASPSDRKIRAQVGGYYYDWNFKTRSRQIPGIAAVTGGSRPIFENWELRELENVALFGQFDWDFMDNLTLSIEGRWGRDTKGTIPANSDCANVEAEFDNFTPRITLRWQSTDEVNLYLLAAKGNKPGDFNDAYFGPEVSCDFQAAAISNRSAVVEEEEQWTYEAGMKSNWFEGRFTANLAVFYIDWTNQGTFATVQIPSMFGPPTPSTVTQNAGKSEVMGFELESNFVATENLTFIANYGFSDGEFVEGENEFLLNNTGNGDLKGKEIPSTPKHQIILGAVARQSITADSEIFMRTDYVYESERWSQAANFGKVAERKLVNVRLGIDSNNWTLGGYVTNLLDDDAPLATLNFVDFNDGRLGIDGVQLSNGNIANMWTLNPQRGREWGIEFQYRVGGR